MKKNILPIALASTLLVAACSPDSITSAAKDDSEKTPIEFSMTDNTASVVAVNGNTRAGFTAETGIVMQMVATVNSSSSTSQTKTTKTTAKAAAESSNYSNVTFENGNVRYWDDAYGRDTKLSIYAVAVPGKSTTDVSALTSLPGGETFSTSDVANTLTWSVTQSTAQTADNIDAEDLVYSNNIQKDAVQPYCKNGVYRWDFTASPPGFPSFDGNDFSKLKAGQMMFALKNTEDATGPGKFDKGNLNFLHALCRVTVKVVLSDGFTNDESAANTVNAPVLKSQPYTGTFNVKSGTFSDTTSGDVTMASTTSETKTFYGQVLPDGQIQKDKDDEFLHFKVGDNVYYVSQAKVFSALTAGTNKDSLKYTDTSNQNVIKMTQGQNYVLTITVSKTKIDNITATLADWTTIEGSAERNNAYLTFTFSDYATNNHSKNFTLYRSKYTYSAPITATGYDANYDWNTGYSAATTLEETTSGSNVWKTDWYWDSNKDFYHFRMVGKGSADASAVTISTDNTDSSNPKQYFEIKSGTSAGDYRWGAPMAKSGDTDLTLTYNTTNGFDALSNGETNSHHISAAIGATESTIHLTEVNTLAKIVVKLTTSEGADKVTFKDGDSKTTKVELLNIYATGNVYMGNGLVKPSGSRTATSSMTANGDANEFNYFVVPQPLVDDGDTKTYVAFKITTPDGNIYYVKEKLSAITATRNTNTSSNVSIGQTANNAIDYWYPNCTYTYTFKLTKTGINAISATLVPYTEITAADTDINLED